MLLDGAVDMVISIMPFFHNLSLMAIFFCGAVGKEDLKAYLLLIFC